jgi:hypothetical protein
MGIVAIILSGLSLVVTVVGTALSNRRSSEALKESRKAADSALWSGMQEAVQRLIGFDPASEPIGERLANLRIAGIALIDGLDGWEGFDTWLEVERARGAALGREVMDRAKFDDSVERRLEILEHYHLWAQVLSSNLRMFRTTGYDAKVAAQLRDIAEQHHRSLYEKHGWGPPPSLATSKIKPLSP